MMLRTLPSVDQLAARIGGPHGRAVLAARVVIDARRAALQGGAQAADDEPALLEQRAREWLEPSLRRVVNATGVVLHTNLGRAPLAAAAREAVARVAAGYANLEIDLATGVRGSRHDHVAGLLAGLTGAQDAIAVNNGAGAVLLAVASHPGEIVVSRGQLIEIGGGFRIPEVIAQMGGRLIEVGTTNRTRLADYEAAVGPATGAVLRAHTSNFRQLGFVEDVPVEALTGLGVPVIDDVGSGALGPLHDEPPVRHSVKAGAALVCFSADKLLGGPQAGLLVGTAEAVARAREHPLARALRIDKLSLAALEATLRLHLDPDLARAEIPALAMLERDTRPLAEHLAAASGGEVVPVVSKAGGGTLPLLELHGWGVSLPVQAIPGVVGRVEAGRLILDPRTLLEDELEPLAAQLAARRGTEMPDS
jgi:L-seryl-tRNA(Ser) seleniumtransferase